jgi:membrane protease YdiL (CAAX protease family)
VYQRTGSLFPGMLAHAVNNATGLILFYAVGLR